MTVRALSLASPCVGALNAGLRRPLVTLAGFVLLGRSSKTWRETLAFLMSGPDPVLVQDAGSLSSEQHRAETAGWQRGGQRKTLHAGSQTGKYRSLNSHHSLSLKAVGLFLTHLHYTVYIFLRWMNFVPYMRVFVCWSARSLNHANEAFPSRFKSRMRPRSIKKRPLSGLQKVKRRSVRSSDLLTLHSLAQFCFLFYVFFQSSGA